MEPELQTDPRLAKIEAELREREPIFHKPDFGATCANYEAQTAGDGVGRATNKEPELPSRAGRLFALRPPIIEDSRGVWDEGTAQKGGRLRASASRFGSALRSDLPPFSFRCGDEETPPVVPYLSPIVARSPGAPSGDKRAPAARLFLGPNPRAAGPRAQGADAERGAVGEACYRLRRLRNGRGGLRESVSLAVGTFVIVVGATFASWGVYRLSRPRRRADVQWIRSNPLSNLSLGGLGLGFDRSGALTSLLVGVFAIFLGIAALLA